MACDDNCSCVQFNSENISKKAKRPHPWSFVLKHYDYTNKIPQKSLKSFHYLCHLSLVVLGEIACKSAIQPTYVYFLRLWRTHLPAHHYSVHAQCTVQPQELLNCFSSHISSNFFTDNIYLGMQLALKKSHNWFHITEYKIGHMIIIIINYTNEFLGSVLHVATKDDWQGFVQKSF